ncbi:MAG TPA: triose-phosphate isomerase [Burkholderiaceae bacterium]|jgi:triosephosphate isomerase|nr:triose-phosphate isomerase [Burkholderiaceae bacterium]
MKARKPMVAGNWKMNGDIVSNEHLFTALRAELGRASLAQVEVVVCPPYPYLGQAAAWLGDTGIAWGAQDVSALPNGAYTGDVSASMLVDLGCRWAIVGHSERRQLAGETDEQVAAKVSMCVAQGVGVIACVGETLEEREAGATDAVLGRQVDAIAQALTATGETLAAALVVLAYEPVWAIGTGRTASPEIAQAAHLFIRERLAARGYRDPHATRILYGGSVKPGNAVSLFAMPDVDGGLIGGASLVADDFLAICRSAAVARP